MKAVKDQDHAQLSDVFNIDEDRVNWHDETLWFIRQKRDKAAHSIPDWEKLRETASQIKNNVLSNLHDYLIQFEENAKANGVIIHWAADGKEHNDIVYSILKKHGINQMVKS
ncbi:MAG TPA: 4Fe-4S ferredoxin, partial [Pedobacter sp.]